MVRVRRLTASAATVEDDVGRLATPVIEKILNDTVIEKARSYADAAGLPEKFRDGIELRRNDSGASATSPEWSVINTFRGKFGEPLAEWFEEGTKRGYVIRPKLDHPGAASGTDQQPHSGFGQRNREEDDEPRNIYTERDVAHVEHGDDTTRQHPSVLSWLTGGIRVFRKQVKHPGREPVAAMDLALHDSIAEARRAVEAALPEVDGYDVKVELELVRGD